MLNKENEIIRHTTPCIKDRPFMFIARACDQASHNIRVVLMPLTDEQEQLLNENKGFIVKALNTTFNVDPNNCYLYGEIDLSPNSKYLKALVESNPFVNLETLHYLFSEYDYETHTVTSDVKRGRWYESDRLQDYLPYLYACINKPRKIVIFKEYLNTMELIKAKQRQERDSKYYNKHKDKINKRVQERRNVKKKARLTMLTFNIK